MMSLLLSKPISKSLSLHHDTLYGHPTGNNNSLSLDIYVLLIQTKSVCNLTLEEIVLISGLLSLESHICKKSFVKSDYLYIFLSDRNTTLRSKLWDSGIM